MKKIKSLKPFKTKAHQVIAREKGEIIIMPDEDYEEVKDLCEVLDDTDRKKKPVYKSIRRSKKSDDIDA